MAVMSDVYISKTMFECENAYLDNAYFFSCADASLQVVVVAKVEDGANLTIQSCSFTS